MKTVFRTDGQDRAYTRISNKLLQNRALSWETRGMLCDILSRNQNWNINPSGLADMGGCGRDRVYRLIKEASAAGYMRMDERRDERGHRVECAYVVSDDPDYLNRLPNTFCSPNNRVLDTEKPDLGNTEIGALNPENPDPGKPDLANRTQQRKETNKGKIKEQTYCANEDLRGEGDPAFEDFWQLYPCKRGKVPAQKTWKTYSREDKVSAITAITPYKFTEEVQRGAIQHGSTYLSKRTWKDFQPEPKNAAEIERDQVRDVALDLAREGEPNRIKAHGWASFDDVKRSAAKIWAAAVEYARREYGWQPSLFAAAA